jgi:hypothetical protein
MKKKSYSLDLRFKLDNLLQPFKHERPWPWMMTWNVTSKESRVYKLTLEQTTESRGALCSNVADKEQNGIAAEILTPVQLMHYIRRTSCGATKDYTCRLIKLEKRLSWWSFIWINQRNAENKPQDSNVSRNN